MVGTRERWYNSTFRYTYLAEAQHKQFVMFPYREMCRPFMMKLLECATSFANNQVKQNRGLSIEKERR
jgi:hypothetical protein